MLKALCVGFLVTIALGVLVEATGTVLNCTEPNEEYQCGSACQTTCSNLGEPCPVQNIRCNDACYCIKGYARDDAGTCISIADCPPKKGH